MLITHVTTKYVMNIMVLKVKILIDSRWINFMKVDTTRMLSTSIIIMMMGS